MIARFRLVLAWLSLSTLLMVGCSSSSDPFHARLNAASATWAQSKTTCRTYSYVRKFPASSVFGWRSWTWIEIRDDLPSRRRYVFYPSGAETPSMEWEETGAEVGLHAENRHAGPYAPNSVQQLLQECETFLREAPVTDRLELVSTDKGVPSRCTATSKNCVDDCIRRIDVSEFACAPLFSDGGVDQ